MWGFVVSDAPCNCYGLNCLSLILHVCVGMPYDLFLCVFHGLFGIVLDTLLLGVHDELFWHVSYGDHCATRVHIPLHDKGIRGRVLDVVGGVVCRGNPSRFDEHR